MASWNMYPHVTTDAAVSEGQPCIADTGIRVSELATAHENGNSPADLLAYFKDREGRDGVAGRPLTFPEVYAALAFYYDNVAALDAVRAEEKRLAEEAKKERHAAIMKRFLGQ